MVVPDTAIVNVMLPQMQRALGFSGTGLEWVVNAYALTFGGLMLLGGRAGTCSAAAKCSSPGWACSPPRRSPRAGRAADSARGAPQHGPARPARRLTSTLGVAAPVYGLASVGHDGG